MKHLYDRLRERTRASDATQQRAAKSRRTGAGDAVKVHVKCAPVDGKANKELVETLAEAFGLPKSAVVFKSGETSKTKRILLRGVTASALAARLGGNMVH